MRDFRSQYDEHHLDEVVVGAIAHFVSAQISSSDHQAESSAQLKDAFRQWQPLQDEERTLLAQLERWKKAYRYSDATQEDSAAVDLFGGAPSAARSGQQGAMMTPYEAMLNAMWLPKVRSAIKWVPICFWTAWLRLTVPPS